MRKEIRNKILTGIVATAYVISLGEFFLHYLQFQLMDEKEKLQQIEKYSEQYKEYLFLSRHYPRLYWEETIRGLRIPFNLIGFLSSITIFIYTIYLAIKMVSFLLQLSKAAVLDLCNLRYLIKNDPQSVLT